MAWHGSQKRRQHRSESGAMSFSQAELDRAFGRGKFEPLFYRIDFFQRSPGWSRSRAMTRAFWLSSQVREAIRAYQVQSETQPTNLLWLSGEKIKIAKRIPSAISSVDTNGRATKTNDWANAKGMTRVPVDVDMLRSLRNWTDQAIEDGDRLDKTLRQFLERLRDISTKIIKMAQSHLAGPGHILQVYSISPGGRLYARGLNLQNAPRLIKDAALHGLWEYDFSNCHFAIVSRMAKSFGLACPHVEHYMADKAQVRQQIADEVGISVEAAKQCLLALLYGARPSGRANDAIPAAIGVDAAKRLYAQPAFHSLRHEIEQARGAIINGWIRTPNGSLKNACGKAIRGNARPAALLAHLVQGVEARALMSIVDVYAKDIVLLQHDGFTARKRLDSARLEQVVRDQVGYTLKVEESQLELNTDARLMSRMKSEIALEAAPDLGFDSVSAD
jgi:hypothetical protein